MQDQAFDAPPPYWRLYIPKLITGLQEGYDLQRFRGDIIAGLTVAIVALPLSMALAVATVTLAGVLFGIKSSFDPFVGPARLIYGFEAVIIGGLGSLWGTLVGGIVLGVAQGLGRQINPQWGELAGHAVFLAVLAARPTGLFGKGQVR